MMYDSGNSIFHFSKNVTRFFKRTTKIIAFGVQCFLCEGLKQFWVVVLYLYERHLKQDTVEAYK